VNSHAYKDKFMPFQVIEVLSVESDKLLARINHHNHTITGTITNKNSAEIIHGQSFQAGIGYSEILDLKVIPDFDDVQSGIWQDNDGIHLRGKVHSMVDFGDGVTTIDVYIQNGPDFFTVNLEAMNNEPPEGNDGLEIIVDNLYLYPSDQ
jgi:hypothetical protein